jgi:hypothetical protein
MTLSGGKGDGGGPKEIGYPPWHEEERTIIVYVA